MLFSKKAIILLAKVVSCLLFAGCELKNVTNKNNIKTYEVISEFINDYVEAVIEEKDYDSLSGHKIKDAWGSEIKIVMTSGCSSELLIFIISAGADLAYYTEDDIVMVRCGIE